MAIGASNTQGIYVGREDAYPAELQRLVDDGLTRDATPTLVGTAEPGASQLSARRLDRLDLARAPCLDARTIAGVVLDPVDLHRRRVREVDQRHARLPLVDLIDAAVGARDLAQQPVGLPHEVRSRDGERLLRRGGRLLAHRC